MKVKRRKRVDRFLSFFRNSFGFREPYQVLVDGTFCQAALHGHMAVREQVTKYLSGDDPRRPAKLLTTCCAVVETDKLGRALHGASLILKKFPVHVCGHEKSPVSGAACLRSMVADGNPHRYIVATQDKVLKTKLRELPGVPLMYVHYRGPVLEKPSEINEMTATNAVKSRCRPSEHEMETLKRIKKEMMVVDVNGVKRGKRKRIRGPNPLSCKRKKIKLSVNVAVSEADAKRKRRKRVRVKVPKHVKEHLAPSASMDTGYRD